MERELAQERLSQRQIVIIRSARIMGEALTERLGPDQALRDELEQQLHDPNQTYPGMLRSYFFESKRDALSVLTSPFVHAFSLTPLCQPEEQEFIQDLTTQAEATGGLTEADAMQLQDWIEERIPYMVKGLQECILNGNVITPLSPEEVRQKIALGRTLDQAANPDKYTAIQQGATKAAAEAASPRTYTTEVRAQIQQWFDEGYRYNTVVELLKGLGIHTTVDLLINNVSRHKLRYTPAERDKERRLAHREAAVQIYHLSGSRSTTMDILELLGYSRDVTDRALTISGERHRFDWEIHVSIQGESLPLVTIVSQFIRSYPTVKDEYTHFLTYLSENDITMRPSFYSYQGIRRRIRERQRG